MGEILLSEEARKAMETSFDERRAAFEREAQKDVEAFRREVAGKNRSLQGSKAPLKTSSQGK